MNFIFFYQDVIPQLHHELIDTSLNKMSKVLYVGTGISALFFVLNGIFGAITWSKFYDKIAIMEGENILVAPYGDEILIHLCIVGIIIVALFNIPFLILPCKDSLEELLLKHD